MKLKMPKLLGSINLVLYLFNEASAILMALVSPFRLNKNITEISSPEVNLNTSKVYKFLLIENQMTWQTGLYTNPVCQDEFKLN